MAFSPDGLQKALYPAEKQKREQAFQQAIADNTPCKIVYEKLFSLFNEHYFEPQEQPAQSTNFRSLVNTLREALRTLFKNYEFVENLKALSSEQLGALRKELKNVQYNVGRQRDASWDETDVSRLVEATLKNI